MVALNLKPATEKVSVDAIDAVRLVLKGSVFPIEILLPGTPTVLPVGSNPLENITDEELKWILEGLRDAYVQPALLNCLDHLQKSADYSQGTMEDVSYQASLEIIEQKFIGEVMDGILAALESPDIVPTARGSDFKNFKTYAATILCNDAMLAVKALKHWKSTDRALRQRKSWAANPDGKIFKSTCDYAGLMLPKLS